VNGSLTVGCNNGTLLWSIPPPLFLARAVPAPVIAFVEPPSAWQVGSGLPLQFVARITVVAGSALTNSPWLTYEWSYAIVNAQTGMASASLALPPTVLPLLFIDPAVTQLTPGVSYAFTVRVVDSTPDHWSAVSGAPTSAATTVLTVTAAVQTQVNTSSSIVDPCAGSTLCLNGGRCVATRLTDAPPTATLRCDCPTFPAVHFGQRCNFVVLDCPQCVASYAGGQSISLIGIGLDTLRGVSIAGRVIPFLRPDSANATDEEVKAAREKFPQYAEKLQRITFEAPRLVERNQSAGTSGSGTHLHTLNSNGMARELLASPTEESGDSGAVVVNPPSAYQTLTLKSLLLSSDDRLLEVNLTSLLFYSSSKCVATGIFKEDGGQSQRVQAARQWRSGILCELLLCHALTLSLVTLCLVFVWWFGSAGGCLPCPVGALCPGGGRAWPLPGYWSWSEFSTPVACSPPEACPGVTSAAAAASNNPFTDTQQCSEAYTGARCADCSGGYYQLQGKCFYCGSSVDQSSTIATTLVIGVSVMILLSAAAATLPAMQLAAAIQIFALLQGAAAVGVQGAKSSPYFGEQLHEAMTYLNFSQCPLSAALLSFAAAPLTCHCCHCCARRSACSSLFSVYAYLCAILSAVNFDVEVIKPGCGGVSVTQIQLTGQWTMEQHWWLEGGTDHTQMDTHSHFFFLSACVWIFFVAVRPSPTRASFSSPCCSSFCPRFSSRSPACCASVYAVRHQTGALYRSAAVTLPLRSTMQSILWMNSMTNCPWCAQPRTTEDNQRTIIQPRRSPIPGTD
jgi:hypothetical protein